MIKFSENRLCENDESKNPMTRWVVCSILPMQTRRRLSKAYLKALFIYLAEKIWIVLRVKRLPVSEPFAIFQKGILDGRLFAKLSACALKWENRASYGRQSSFRR